MKKIFNSITIILSAAVIGISSCDKGPNLIDENNKWVYLDSSNSANIKVIQVFAGNAPVLPTASSALYTGPQIFIYANSTKLNGVALSYINGVTYTGTSTTPNALGSPWPITSVYANIPAGSNKFDIINARLNLTAVPSIPGFIAGDTLATLTATLDKGKYYTLYIGDTVPSVKVTLKEDILPVPDYQTYKVRLANFIMNNSPQDTITLFSRRQNALIKRNIKKKNIKDKVQIPLPNIADTLEKRKKGSLLSYISINGFSPTGLRMYTVLARGKSSVTAKVPSASIITNR